ncbi:MAG: hypothetical protein KA743_12345, partial [Geothrix sp.]|nr:hypothetical protein [Geothrix sp.]
MDAAGAGRVMSRGAFAWFSQAQVPTPPARRVVATAIQGHGLRGFRPRAAATGGADALGRV